MFETSSPNNSGFLFDFKDGTLYKNHPLFSVDDNALQLIIYYDDVEPANPLGSYRGHHKLGKSIIIAATVIIIVIITQVSFTIFLEISIQS